MLYFDVLVVGGGPAGMSAALVAANKGANVILIDSGKQLGGQLVKQTHRFFGSEHEYAGTRGIDIAEELRQQVFANPRIDVRSDSVVLAAYSDGLITFLYGQEYCKVRAEQVIIACGASEKMLPFVNNDLPGVYGAGAVQTLMNVHGIVPGQKVLMVGAGNIGLIVSYQLIQAGVEVAAIIDAADAVGGYLVHASKVRRLGVPIKTRYTISRALGEHQVEGAVIQQVDDNFKPIAGTEEQLDVDTVCLSVGLSPLRDLLGLYKCQLKHVPRLGGWVPVHDKYMETSVPGVYVAGDVACIEEASSAMVEGNIAGLSAVIALGIGRGDLKAEREQMVKELDSLRSGPVGEKIRAGLQQLAE